MQTRKAPCAPDSSSFSLERIIAGLCTQTNCESLACLRFAPGEPRVVIGSRLDFAAELADARSWYLIDGHGAHGNNALMTPDVNATVVGGVAPDCAFFQEFMKEGGARRLYMPPWGMDEMEALRRIQGEKVSAAELKKYFTAFGGVPRTVLMLIGRRWKENEDRQSDSAWDAVEHVTSLGTLQDKPVAELLVHLQASSHACSERSAFGALWLAGALASACIPLPHRCHCDIYRDWPAFSLLRVCTVGSSHDHAGYTICCMRVKLIYINYRSCNNGPVLCIGGLGLPIYIVCRRLDSRLCLGCIEQYLNC